MRQPTTYAPLCYLCCLVSVFSFACSPAMQLPTGSPGPGTRVDRFIVYANGTALDTQTQLMWMTQDYLNLEGKGPFSPEMATAWFAKMNRRRYGGHRDWRTPTRAEYQTLYDPAHSRRSHQGNAVGYPAIFADGGGEWCWTDEIAEPGSGHIHYMWKFDFIKGEAARQWAHADAHGGGVPPPGCVRLVRGPVDSVGRSQ